MSIVMLMATQFCRYLPCKVNLNGNSKSTVEMAFIDNKTPRASACLTKLTLTQAGVDTSILGDDVKDDETSCVDIKILSRCF